MPLLALPDDLLAKILPSTRAIVHVAMTCTAARERLKDSVAMCRDASAFMDELCAHMHRQVSRRLHRRISIRQPTPEYAQIRAGDNKYATIRMKDPHTLIAKLYYNAHKPYGPGRKATCFIKYSARRETGRVYIGPTRIAFCTAHGRPRLDRVLKRHRFWK